MFAILFSLFSSIRQVIRSRAALQAEILALRHQLLVLQSEKKDCPCPKCRAMGMVRAVAFEVERFLPNGGSIPRLERIDDLLARGYVLLREAGRDAVLAMGASP